MTKQNNSAQVSDHLRAWRSSLIIVALLFSTLFLLHFDTLISLTKWWSSTTKYGHALIIFPAIIYLLYDRRNDYIHLIPHPQPIILIPLFCFTALLSISEMINVQIASETAIITIFVLIVWLFLGNKITAVIAIPLLLLFMVVPAWEIFSPILTEATADIAQYCLNVLGVPIHREGGYLTIPEGVFHVEEGCGGFRYFIAGLSLALVYAYLFYESLKQRLIIIISSIIISIVVNWVRVMIVIWAGHVTEMQHHFVKAHLNLGWWLFLGAFGLFFIVSSRYSASPIKSPYSNNASGAHLIKHTNVLTYILVGSGALLIICFLPALDKLFGNQTYQLADESRLKTTFAMHLDNWDGPAPYSGDWAPSFAGANGEIVETYKKDGVLLAVYIAYYYEQKQGHELINIHNTLVNESWRHHSTKYHTIIDEDGSNFDLREIVASSGNLKKAIWTWYYVSGSETVSPWVAKLFEAKKLLSSNNLSAVIAVLPVQGIEHDKIENIVPQFLASYHAKLHRTFNEE